MRIFSNLLLFFVIFGGLEVVSLSVSHAEHPAGRLDYSSYGPDSAHSTELELLLIKAASDFETTFKLPKAASIRVSILPPEQLREEIGAPQWATGIFHQGRILIPNNEYALSPETLRKTIRHEYVHAVVAEISAGKCPAWLDEGLAQLFEGKRVSRKDFEALQLLARKDITPSLRTLNEGFTALSKSQALDSYRFSLFATSHLLDISGAEQVKKFLFLLSGNRVFEEAFDESFGMKLESFENNLSRLLSDS